MVIPFMDATNARFEQVKTVQNAQFPTGRANYKSIRGRPRAPNGLEYRPMQPSRFVLASASPRRRTLLAQIGLRVTVEPSAIEELSLAGESAREQAQRLAVAKGRHVVSRLSGEPAVVIAADTIVAVAAESLGKPADADEAARMLRRLRGTTHEVITGVFLQRTDDGRTFESHEVTEVRFRDFDDSTLDAYAHCGEPLDKAGGYAIQERGALLVERIDGSWSNVVGLPVERLPGWLERIGVNLTEALNWRAY